MPTSAQLWSDVRAGASAIPPIIDDDVSVDCDSHSVIGEEDVGGFWAWAVELSNDVEIETICRTIRDGVRVEVERETVEAATTALGFVLGCVCPAVCGVGEGFGCG